MSCHGGLDATDLAFPDDSSPKDCSNIRLGLQSSGSSVQVPLGQSEAPMAEHSPVQLVPWPHVTLVRVVLGEQQPTSIDSLVKVKAESKKSTSVVVVLPLRYHLRFESNQGGAKANKKTYDDATLIL